MAQPRLTVWIDASAPESSLRVFGMTLVERQLAALREITEAKGARFELASVVVSHAAGARPALRGELASALNVELREATGSLSERLARAGADAPLLALPGDAILDTRVLAALANGGDDVAFVCGEGEERSALVRFSANAASPQGATLREIAEAGLASGALRPLASDAVATHITNLRRDQAPYAFRLVAARLEERERWLFESNYKGSTDFLTRYVFPPFVWAAVRPLTRWRVHPNWVTGLAVALCFGAIPLWASGQWLLGFIAAYVMAVLDSVDGKVARLTYTTSAIGNVMDHGTDIVHPPFWYAAWAWGMAGGPHGRIYEVTLALFAIYTLDRIVAGLFSWKFGRSIHGWAPLDARMRTFISRRNVNLPVFTLALPLGWGGEAIVAVAAWQVACLVFHGARFLQVAAQNRPTRG